MPFILTPKQREALQLLTLPEVTNIAFAGGSRSGKTMLFCYAMVIRALKSPGSRHAAFRNICRDARAKLGLGTLPELHRLIGITPTYDKTGGRFIYPGEAELHLLGLDDAGDHHSRVLGSGYSTLLFDECTEIPYESTVFARTRLADRNLLVKRAFYAFNPPTRNHWLYSLFVSGIDPVDRRPLHHPESYRLFKMNPSDNVQNLDPAYLESLDGLPARQRLRFRDGEWGNPVEGVLWKVEWIENNRASSIKEEVQETVIGVDPACGGACETGVVALSRGSSGHIYIIGDRSSRSTPAEWALSVVTLAREVGTRRVIAESNMGGEMVRSVLQTADPSLQVELVHAGTSKRMRAEPIAALAERGMLHHIGHFEELEDQLCSYVPGGDSPDRLDALVHGATALLSGVATSVPHVAPPAGLNIEDDSLWQSL